MGSEPSSVTLSAGRFLLGPILRWLSSGLRIVGLNDAQEAIKSVAREHRSIVFYHWTEDELARLLVATRGPVEVGREVTYVADDTLGGRLGAAVLEGVGSATLECRRSADRFRLGDMRGLIKAAGNISISADARGPYRIVNPQLARLVAQRGAVAVPVSTRASRTLISIARPWPLIVPATGATVAVAVGPVILREVAIGAGELERGLEVAYLNAEQLLAH